MQVATNMLCSEAANLLIDAKREGLELKGIVCPYIELPSLQDVLRYNGLQHIRIITREATIKKWHRQLEEGKIPAKYNTKEFNLDWVKRLKEIGKNSYRADVEIEGNKITIDIHIEPDYYIHTKLYVFDKGFVITSGNITHYGTLRRHLEMGVLITEEDNKLEFEIVKEWFETRWIGDERACRGIKYEKTMNFSKKIIEKVLEKEIAENQKNQGYPEFYFSSRLLCFGCDEGRNGDVLTRTVQIENNNYDEVICEGCNNIINKLRVFMPPFVQEISHEGRVVWRISKKYYEDKNNHLYRYEKYDENDVTISFDLTDNGSIDKFIQALIASKITNLHICLACGNGINPDFKICPYCGISVKTHRFEI